MASSDGLGAVVHEFRLGQRGRWLALQILLLLVAMCSLMMGAMATFVSDITAPRAVLVGRLMLGGGAALFVVGAWLVPRLARGAGRGLALVLHEGGLVQHRDRARQATAWHEVRGVREQLHRIEQAPLGRTIHPWIGRIETVSGHLDLPDAGGHALLALIEAQVRPHVWQRMIAALARGESFAFGTVVARPDGLTIGAERLAWSQVQLVTEEDHALRIHTDLGGTVLDRFDVSFRTVLETLLEEMWTHQGDLAALPPTLPAAAPPVFHRDDLPAARLLR